MTNSSFGPFLLIPFIENRGGHSDGVIVVVCQL
jgi:hypothetical protein